MGCLLLAATLWLGEPGAGLLAGMVLGVLTGDPFRRLQGAFQKRLLQASVVGLGFGMEFSKVIAAGVHGLWLSVLTVCGTLGLGLFAGRLLGVRSIPSALISVGTAICGGSAIAAVGPVLGATAEELSLSLSVVFLLNSAGLFVFPAIGQLLHLPSEQFGVWSAIAIHDTSSVVGAAAKFGNDALSVAVPIKLARALWILPIVVLLPRVLHRLGMAEGELKRASFPLFILYFLLASLCASFLPGFAALYTFLVWLAKRGMVATLFLVGSGVSLKAIRELGPRPFFQGVLLWLFISVSTLVILQNVGA